MNERILDHTNVLLLRPLRPLTILRAVDPLEDAGGVGVAQIFAVKEENLGAFCQKAEAAFEQYVQTGVREAGLLVTLDAPNNFPRLPYRTDGPYLVWLGIVKDNEILEGGFQPLAEHSLESLSAGDFLRQPPEQIFLDPTNRSRLRWLD